MRLIDGVVVFGDADENTMAQARTVRRTALSVALMADNHLGYIMPIGGVAAYENMVSVVGIGFDVGCGNAAIRTNLKLENFDRRELVRIANAIESNISFGVGRKNQSDDAPIGHALFESPAWEAVPAQFRHNLKGKARSQLGTVGSGNHYVDILADETGAVWVGVHFGSRGFGHTVATGFLNLFQGLPWDARAKEVEALLDLNDPMGQDYWQLMELAGSYAYAGREWVARKVVQLMGGEELELVHNHHNYAWPEDHWIENEGGEGELRRVIVVRKGATPAFRGQKGFIGGSMGDDAVIVQGTEAELYGDDAAPKIIEQQTNALYSTVHGAGRVMSRTAAAGKRNRRTGEVKVPGLISPEMMDAWLKERDVILRGGGLDESPHAYRRLPDVLAAQGQTIEVLHTLRPIIVVMAGANEYDPYKD
jgi:tRNA-splicing ligase RtcB